MLTSMDGLCCDLVMRPAVLGSSWNDLFFAVVAAVLIYATVIAASRIVGLRSFSKISSFDFAMTVAVGAIIGRVVLVDVSLLTGVVTLITLFALQWLVSKGRRRIGLDRIVDNQPVVLYIDGTLRQHAVRRCRLAEQDILEQVRQNGFTHLDDVDAIIMERTGDISVMAGTRDAIDPRLLEGVYGVPAQSAGRSKG